MVKCALCEKEVQDNRALQGHVRTIHKTPWEDYKKQFGAQKLEEKKMEKHEKKEVKKKATEKLSPEDVDAIAKRVTELLEKGDEKSGATQLPPGVTPIGEEVEVKGEKINYKVALNPEIFYFYSIFKAEAVRRGRKWEGDFSDFMYLAAKDVLTAHGLHPAVLSVKGGSLLVKLPISALQREGD